MEGEWQYVFSVHVILVFMYLHLISIRLSRPEMSHCVKNTLSLLFCDQIDPLYLDSRIRKCAAGIHRVILSQINCISGNMGLNAV